MIQGTTVEDRTASRHGILGYEAVCDTPECRKRTKVMPDTEDQATIAFSPSDPPPWIEQVLRARKWSMANGGRTFCKEHSIDPELMEELISDDPELVVEHFLSDNGAVFEDGYEPSYGRVFEVFTEWCEKNEYDPIGKKAFGRAMRDNGWNPKTKGIRVNGKPSSVYAFVGLKLNDEPKRARVRKKRVLDEHAVMRLEIEVLELREYVEALRKQLWSADITPIGCEPGTADAIVDVTTN